MVDRFRMSEDKSQARLACDIVTKREGSQERSRWFRASVPIVDRHRAIVRTEGIQTDEYVMNPVFGWAHDLYFEGAPMEHVIGKTINMEQDSDRFDVEVEFVPSAIHPYGEMALQMIDGGFLSMVSIGIRGIDTGFVTINGVEDVYEYRTSNLFEVSLVPIPANPKAQKLALSLLDSVPAPPGFNLDPAPSNEADVAVVKASTTKWERSNIFSRRYSDV